jgi:hypothetical protein
LPFSTGFLLPATTASRDSESDTEPKSPSSNKQITNWRAEIRSAIFLPLTYPEAFSHVLPATPSPLPQPHSSQHKHHQQQQGNKEPLLLSLTIALSLTTLLLTFRRWHTTESLLVLQTLGIQTQTTSGSHFDLSLGLDELISFSFSLLPSQLHWQSWGIYSFGCSTNAGGSTTRFIPTSRIQDVFIHEAFRGWEVRYYLVFVVEGEGEFVVVFAGLEPGLDVVLNVWRGVRAVLFEGGSGSAKTIDSDVSVVEGVKEKREKDI